MVNATIPHPKHFFQAPPHPQSILGKDVAWKNVEVHTVQSGWGALPSSRLFYVYPLQNSEPESLPPPGWKEDNTTCPWRGLFLHLAHALDRLEETTIQPECCISYAHDAAIQRFEFCIELFLEIFRKIAAVKGKAPESQRGIVRIAYALKLIDNASIWLAMVKNRNQTSHTYTPTLSKEIYGYIPFYYEIMRKTYEGLKEKLIM